MLPAPPLPRAARREAPLYTVALVPLAAGFAAAYWETGLCAAGVAARLAAGSCLIIAWLNLSNDAWDAGTSVDVRKWESVVRLLGGGAPAAAAVHALALYCFAVGAKLLWEASAAIGDPRVATLLAAAVACGHVYQAPPFRFSYKGLGEPLCFAAFGPLATTAFYLAARAAVGDPAACVTDAVWVCTALVGTTTSVILFCSHFHQVEDDLAAGKRSPVARLGVRRAAALLRMPLLGAYALLATAAYTGALPPLAAGVASAASAPFAWKLASFVSAHHEDPATVRVAKYLATRWHAALGAALALGLACSRSAAL